MTDTKKLLAGLATAALLFGAPVAFAQTTTTDGTASTTDATTPGAPNTGQGGDASVNLFLLAVSGLVVVAGGAYLARRAVAK